MIMDISMIMDDSPANDYGPFSPLTQLQYCRSSNQMVHRIIIAIVHGVHVVHDRVPGTRAADISVAAAPSHPVTEKFGWRLEIYLGSYTRSNIGKKRFIGIPY